MAKLKADKPPKPPKKEMSPQKKKRLYWGGGGFLFFLIVVMAFLPAQGTMHYGVCKVYVELSELYPREITYLSVEGYGDPVKIFYKKVDPFGVDSVNSIECFFKRDNTGNLSYELSKVDINGKFRAYEAEKPENIKRFNLGVPAILANPPDLTLPWFSQDNIAQYKDAE